MKRKGRNQVCERREWKKIEEICRKKLMRKKGSETMKE